jgi:hypothetical protein
MRKILMAAAATMLTAMPANAVITTFALTGGNVQSAGGVFQVTSLPSIAVNTINSPDILGINEVQNFTLTNNLRVFNVNVAAGDTPVGTTGSVVIASGTTVNSHLIILDPTDNNINNGGGGNNVSGTVSFNGVILGYIFAQGGNANARGGANFIATNYLGAPGTTYGALHSTLEGGIDAVSFSGNTLTYSMQSGRDVGDYLRVITAVPEPGTWAMLLVGFGMIGLSARRRRTIVAA